MIIYNITAKVDWSIADEWLQWMKTEHIPAVLNTGCFTKFRFVKLLEVDDIEGPTFAVQYYAESRSDYDRYISNYANSFRKQIADKCGNKYIAFRSLMEDVE
jgi:hypothetical protein